MTSLVFPLKDEAINTRAKRRRACKLIAQEIERIRAAEEAYMQRIPENLKNGYQYAYARRTENELFDVEISLCEAFEPF
jgi:hypothetical protein